MQNHRPSDRLSWGDTVFLDLEREGMPLNVASISVFEGEVSFEECVHFIKLKLPLFPRYLKRVVPATFGIGLPHWEDDPEFDLFRHLREVTLKYGTDAELKAVAAELFSKVMNRQHPLWDMTFVRGLKGNRTGFIFRVHHCLADGIAALNIMNVLLCASPAAARAPERKSRCHVPAPPDPLISLVGGFVDSYSDFVNRSLSVCTDLLSTVERFATNDGTPRTQLFRLLPELAAFTEPMRFNEVYRGPQNFAWAEIPLAEVKAIRQCWGTSVNDVLLALVTATVQRYLGLHGDRVKGRLLRIMVPVNLRGNDSPEELGNRISLIPVTIPLDIRNPRKLLVAIHERTEFLKHAHAAELVGLAGSLIGFFPTVLQSIVGPMVSQLPITPFNMVCTNVPGPQYPLYLLGHRMLRWYPYVPVGGEMAVNCAILSYDGTLYFGFSGDVHAAPDLRRFEGLLKLSFTKLQEAAGIRSPRKKKQEIEKVKEKVKVKVKEKRKHAKVTVASTLAPRPASGSASVLARPLASVESVARPRPPERRPDTNE